MSLPGMDPVIPILKEIPVSEHGNGIVARWEMTTDLKRVA